MIRVMLHYFDVVITDCAVVLSFSLFLFGFCFLERLPFSFYNWLFVGFLSNKCKTNVNLAPLLGLVNECTSIFASELDDLLLPRLPVSAWSCMQSDWDIVWVEPYQPYRWVGLHPVIMGLLRWIELLHHRMLYLLRCVVTETLRSVRMYLIMSNLPPNVDCIVGHLNNYSVLD